MTCYVVSEERLAVFGHAAKGEKSRTVKAIDIRDAIAVIADLIEDTLAAVMTSSPDDEKPYGDSLMVAMIPAVIDNAVSGHINYVKLEILLR